MLIYWRVVPPAFQLQHHLVKPHKHNKVLHMWMMCWQEFLRQIVCFVVTAVSDDEAEVPSRNLIKRQALILVDSKARRKGYRAPPKRK